MSKHYQQKTEPITEDQLYKMVNTALIEVLERLEKIAERLEKSNAA